MVLACSSTIVWGLFTETPLSTVHHKLKSEDGRSGDINDQSQLTVH